MRFGLSRVVVSGVLLGLASLPVAAQSAQADRAVAAMERGDYEEAYEALLPLAEAGDTKAMTTIGLFYYEGNGFEQDYERAYEWFLRAYKKRDGDAYNNIGVMFRDGLGVPESPRISYTLFLLTHLLSLGTEGTQYRANRNLRRMVGQLPQDQILEALCFSEKYIDAFVEARGDLGDAGKSSAPSRRRKALREEKELWLDSEWERLRELPPCDAGG